MRQRLKRQVPGVEGAPGLGLRSALSRVPELALTGVPGLALTRLLGLTGVPRLTRVLGLTGVPGLALTRLLGLALTRLLGLALAGVPGLAAFGLRLWPWGPRAGRAATQRCARSLALPNRPVLSHDPAYPPDDSLNAFTWQHSIEQTVEWQRTSSVRPSQLPAWGRRCRGSYLLGAAAVAAPTCLRPPSSRLSRSDRLGLSAGRFRCQVFAGEHAARGALPGWR